MPLPEWAIDEYMANIKEAHATRIQKWWRKKRVDWVLV